ncbi:MAG: hypothetical protein ACREDA_03545, partial [Methylocella sp.]
VLRELYGLMPLAPLHLPHNLAAIEAVFDRLLEFGHFSDSQSSSSSLAFCVTIPKPLQTAV